MEKYEDGVIGPRMEEALDQMTVMNGMTANGKIKYLMSRNCELRAENKRLRHELAMDTFSGLGEIETYKREASVAARKFAQAETENKRLQDQLEEQKCFAADLECDVRALRKLVSDMWNDMCVCHDQHIHPSSRDLRFHADNMRKLGIGVDK